MNIMQSWASGGQAREPILMKFGMQQQVKSAMTVMRSNIKIFTIQNGSRSLLESIRNAIIGLQMDRTVNVLVLWGVQIKKHPQFSCNLDDCAIVVQKKYKIW